MRLTEEIYLVGGGDIGFNLTAGPDSHVYAVRSGGEIALIDTGTGMYTDAVLANLSRDGLDAGDVSRVLVTHYHADHAGGAASLRAATGATVGASAETARALERADEDRIGLTVARSGGYYPAQYRLKPCKVDQILGDDDEIRVGALTIRVIASPGHCDGHLVYLLTGGDRVSLFSGDCLFWGGTIVLQNIPDCRIPEYASTMERLASLVFDALLPGHLAISLSNGQRHVERAVGAFRSSGLPRQLQL